jgi:hypothetical protein
MIDNKDNSAVDALVLSVIILLYIVSTMLPSPLRALAISSKVSNCISAPFIKLLILTSV